MSGQRAARMENNSFRIVFMGTPQFAVPSLQALLDGPDEVVGVVTMPDRRVGRGRKLSAPPVKELAVAAGVPVFQPERLPDIKDALKEMAPDFLVVVAYGKILRPWLLELPKIAPINVHASLLPGLRGAAPIQWAVVRGHRETGVTIMKMDRGMDTGPVILRKTEVIRPHDDSGSLGVRLSVLGAGALGEVLDRLRPHYQGGEPGERREGGGEQGDLLEDLLKAAGWELEIQDHSAATVAPLMSKEDGRINWELTADQLDCFVRGMSPWPGAFTHYGQGRVLRVLRLKAGAVEAVVTVGDGETVPGQVLRVDPREGLVVACGPRGEEAVVLTMVQPQGRRAMEGGAFARGYGAEVGGVLL